MKPQSYAAFLRGVSPMNAKMPQLKAAFESAGFSDVRTLLSSGNVVFTSRPASESELRRKAEDAMERKTGTRFLTIIRRVDALRDMIAADPYRTSRLPPGSKRIVTFLLRRPAAKLDLPMEFEGARILSIEGGEVFSSYVPNPKGPVFMRFLEKTLGREQTTRTWDTVSKVAR